MFSTLNISVERCLSASILTAISRAIRLTEKQGQRERGIKRERERKTENGREGGGREGEREGEKERERERERGREMCGRDGGIKPKSVRATE